MRILRAFASKLPVSPHRFEEPERAAYGMDAADFVGVDCDLGSTRASRVGCRALATTDFFRTAL